jgi:uncharacterized protein YjbI with pentapeptide repeats
VSAPSQSDYSGKDIRGQQFRGLDLHGACFSGAIGGIRPVVKMLLVMGAILALCLAWLVSGYASALPALHGSFTATPRVQLVGLVEAIMLPVILATLWKAGPGRSLAIMILGLAIFTAVVAFAGDGDDSAAAAILLTTVSFFVLASVLLTSLALVLLRTLLRGRWWWLSPVVVATPLLLVGLREGIQISRTETARLGLLQNCVMVGLGLVFTGLPVLISVRAIRGAAVFRALRDLCMGITCACGTSFRGACLDGVDFTGACLPQCDFREASVRLTRWQRVNFLEESRLEGTDLQRPEVRQLLTSRIGTRQNYDRLSLRDLDLDGVKLEHASLVGVDLSGSTLRGASLMGSCLAEARLYGVNLQEAILTKACIENWAISMDTCFDDVNCTEIYLRLPTEADPDPWRKPDNREESFQPGDFKDFVAPIVRTLGLYKHQNLDPRQIGRSMRTLDLYHPEAINPAAAIVAMKQLAAQNPETELELVALEGKGAEKVHLQAVICGSANSSELSRQYQTLYQDAVKLPSEELQQLMATLARQSEQLSHMESLLAMATQSQTNYYIKAGEISGIVNFGNISGNVSN